MLFIGDSLTDPFKLTECRIKGDMLHLEGMLGQRGLTEAKIWLQQTAPSVGAPHTSRTKGAGGLQAPCARLATRALESYCEDICIVTFDMLAALRGAIILFVATCQVRRVVNAMPPVLWKTKRASSLPACYPVGWFEARLCLTTETKRPNRTTQT